MSKYTSFRRLAACLAVSQVLFTAQVPMANASMIGTAEVLAGQQQQVDRQQLLNMLSDQGVQEKLQSLGVPQDQVAARINSLSNAELAQFNQRLQEAPAGSGVVGIIVLFFVIFIVTDMLCATDIFSFVKCINR
ncbi:PA2779 family protein [Pseudomonas sp.]|uniref:PA2779 family protein n=1 Tax=Pseudomonas sp. TaxID=306 RepID=UPI00257D2A87|nr:PA2779 family protein [Pseudomonas sp.]